MSPFIQEAIGVGGFITNVLGNMLLAHKSQRGWGVRIASNLLWLAYAGQTSSFAMTANGVTFMGINVYGWWKWRKEQRAMVTGGEDPR
jgi:nicotinamide riboside transporter PnuC